MAKSGFLSIFKPKEDCYCQNFQLNQIQQQSSESFLLEGMQINLIEQNCHQLNNEPKNKYLHAMSYLRSFYMMNKKPVWITFLYLIKI